MWLLSFPYEVVCDKSGGSVLPNPSPTSDTTLSLNDRSHSSKGLRSDRLTHAQINCRVIPVLHQWSPPRLATFRPLPSPYPTMSGLWRSIAREISLTDHRKRMSNSFTHHHHRPRLRSLCNRFRLVRDISSQTGTQRKKAKKTRTWEAFLELVQTCG